jgi:superfamily II DNA/RNA helicase
LQDPVAAPHTGAPSVALADLDIAVSFADLNISAPTLAGLKRMGITTPTPVQAQSIPPLVAGRDGLIQAPTGSGKTAAFVIPIVELCRRLDDRTRTVALVLCPTRELATQGADVADALLSPHGFRSACLIGGVGYDAQRTQLRQHPQVVFGSPGRVMDFIWDGRLDVSRVAVAVIDEADELLDQGFAQDVMKILSYLPSNRQTILVSATMPEWVRGVVNDELKDPFRVAVAFDPKNEGVIEHRLMETTQAKRFDDLCHLLETSGDGSALVFGRTKWGVQKLYSQLRRAGYRCEVLQGNMSQGQREQALDRFRSRKSPILVATNVAARGIDVRHIGLVVNYELPESAELLTHRIGRTGRAGADGVAVTLVAPQDELKWQRLRRTGAPDLPREEHWTPAERATAQGSTSRPAAGPKRGGRSFRPRSAGRGAAVG